MHLFVMDYCFQTLFKELYLSFIEPVLLSHRFLLFDLFTVK